MQAAQQRVSTERGSPTHQTRAKSSRESYAYKPPKKPVKKDVSFEELLASCILSIREKHSLPHTNTLPSRCRTAPPAPSGTPNTSSKFVTAQSFTVPQGACLPVKTPRLGSPGNLARMGELPSRSGSANSDRCEWVRLPRSPDFYSCEKVLSNPPRQLFSRVRCRQQMWRLCLSFPGPRSPDVVANPPCILQGRKRTDVSAWKSDLACTNYSAHKAQLGFADHQGCGNLKWEQQPCRDYHSAFSSEQPRLIALPTGRSNDSKLTTSLWGDSHRDHYSGAAVGPGTYGPLNERCQDPKYTATLHAYCSNNLGLPESFKAGRRLSVPELVHRYTGVRITCDSSVKPELKGDMCADRKASPGGALAWSVRRGAEFRKRPVGRIMGCTV